MFSYRGTGMVGREVLNLLTQMGAKVISISLDRLKPISKVKYIYGDLIDFKFCKKITKNIDFYFMLQELRFNSCHKKKPSIIFCSFADDEYKYFKRRDKN